MRIWFALLLAPILALTDESIAYATAGWACAHQATLAMHGVHLFFVVVVIVSTFAAGQLWRATKAPAGADETIVRRHFLAGLATASGALSATAILVMWVPNWLLSPCFN
jgi:hypothetical protein